MYNEMMHSLIQSMALMGGVTNEASAAAGQRMGSGSPFLMRGSLIMGIALTGLNA